MPTYTVVLSYDANYPNGYFTNIYLATNIADDPTVKKNALTSRKEEAKNYFKAVNNLSEDMRISGVVDLNKYTITFTSLTSERKVAELFLMRT